MNPESFLASLPHPRKAELTSLHAFIRATAPQLSIGMQSNLLGYGPYHYRYASGREGDTFLISVTNRATGISLYINAVDGETHLAEKYKNQLNATVGKSCIRYKKFSDIDFELLREIIQEAVRLGPPASSL